ncbi:MAG: STM4015 family protein [Cyanobacteria bacterium P01_D01_bin.50]
MAENQNQPGKYDAVLGGKNPPPVTGVVLGGIEGVKRRLSNPVVEIKVAALCDALKYGDGGLELVIQALQQEKKIVQRSAYKLLRKREEAQVKQALEEYQPWYLFERCQENYGYQGLHLGKFANRQIVEFDLQVGIREPKNIAYKLLCSYREDRPPIIEQLTRILQDSQADKLEALVIGDWGEASADDSSEIVNGLVNAKDKLTNLKAIFIGDMVSSECEISWIRHGDISPILRAYPQLEVLQIRGGDGLQFNAPVRHNKLQALVIETGGLGAITVAQICNMNLPELKHLELWFGAEEYGGDCAVENVKPIVDDLIFPNLNYLGLCNSEFSDEIAEAVVKSPLIETISVLDLSLGTLTDKGGEFLLNCAAVNELDIVNLTDNHLSEEMVGKLSALDCQLFTNHQEEIEYEDDEEYRYCSVSE